MKTLVRTMIEADRKQIRILDREKLEKTLKILFG